MRKSVQNARSCVVRAVWLVLSLASFIREGAAQSDKPNAENHEGVWWSVGAGLGSVGLPRGLGAVGSSVHLAAGVTPHPRLLMGLELDVIDGWTILEGDAEGQFRFVTAGVRLYPSDTGGFWLRLGAGGHSSAQPRNETHTRGAVIAVGAGYDFGITKTISSHLEFVWLVAATGRGEILGDTSTDIRPQSKSLRFGITMH